MSEPFKRQVRVRCPLEHAFEVFTAQIDAWWPLSHRRLSGSRLRMEAKPGGRFFERSGSGEEHELGVVLHWQPPHRVTYSWHPGAITGPTEVDVRFHRDGDETLIDLTHAEGDAAMGEAWNERVKIFERAWGVVLPAYLDFVDSPQPTKEPNT